MLIKLLLLAVVIAATVILSSTVYGTSLLFNPRKIPTRDIKNFIEDGLSMIWYDNHENKKTILYCHGNDSNISTRTYVSDACDKLKYNLLLFDYQGYGKSKGTPHQYSLYPDAKKAYNFLIKNNVKPQDIIIWGESLGCSPAIGLAKNVEASSLVLLSPFSSLPEMLSDKKELIFDYGSKVSDYLFDPMDNKKNIKDVSIPIVIIHSIEDKLISFDNAKRLLKNIQHDNKTLVPVTGSHSNPSIPENIILRLDNFLSKPEKSFSML